MSKYIDLLLIKYVDCVTTAIGSEDLATRMEPMKYGNMLRYTTNQQRCLMYANAIGTWQPVVKDQECVGYRRRYYTYWDLAKEFKITAKEAKDQLTEGYSLVNKALHENRYG